MRVGCPTASARCRGPGISPYTARVCRSTLPAMEHHDDGQRRPVVADTSPSSGWVTTDVAAKAVRVSPRTIRRMIDRGELKAKAEGEGIERRWLVDIDSIQALRSSRTGSGNGPVSGREREPADGIADVIRDMAARLEERTAEAVEYRTRLELTELAQSTVEAERERLSEDLARERERADRAERRLGELEASQGPRDGRETALEHRTGGDASESSQEPTQRRSWWRRLFGFD